MRIPLIFNSLTARITIAVIAIIALFTLSLSWLSFSVTSSGLEQAALSRLESLAAARQRILEVQLQDYQGAINSFIQPDLEARLTLLMAAAEPKRSILRGEMESSLRSEAAANIHIAQVSVVDLSGVGIASTNRYLTGTDFSGSPAFLNGQFRLYLGDPFEESGEMFLDTSLPLHDSDGALSAVLIVRFSARELLAIVGDYTGL